MRRGLPAPGDIIITTEAPLGEVAQLDDRKVALAQRLIILRGKRGTLDNTFLKYLMQSKFVQDQLKARASGSTVSGIKQSELRKINLPLPPLPIQHSIASILGSLDDKIELNRQMNVTLEAMARAIYKSWFVDFDPVWAKAEGRQPVGMDAETAALFPDGFEEVEGREVPRGWRVDTLGNVIDLVYGEPLKEENRRGGPVPVYGSNGQIGWHDERLVEGPGIIVGRKGNPGLIHWSATDFFPIDTTFYVLPKKRDFSLYYLYRNCSV